MSGIAGLHYLDGRPADHHELDRMVDILAHRGPDGGAVWSQGPVGLGHRMLYTTPESLHETFPLANRAGDRILTADARIDNREELIGLLGLPTPRHRPVTDGDLILAAYARWGIACPEKLIGDFAFALWDANEQRLFCARDHLGVKPFYYYHRPGRLFAFGSEIKALFCLDSVPRALNKLRIAYYLARVGDDKELTFYQDIVCLPPAHAMTVSRDGVVRRQRYWSLDPERALRLGSDAAYAEGFVDVFTEAVRCRLRSHTAPGVMLSGGLDSSSVACVARDLLGGKNRASLHTFSAIFTDLPDEDLRKSDERPYIEAVRAEGGVDAHLIPLDERSPLADIDDVLWHLDAPCLACNVYLVRSMYSAARNQGVRVVLDGAEGDITVSHGIAYLGELAFSGQWDRFAGEALALTRRAGVSPQGWFKYVGRHYLAHHAQFGRWRAFLQGVRVVNERFGIPRRSLLWQYGLKPRTLRPVRRAWRTVRGGEQATVPAIMADELAQGTDFCARAEAMENRYTPVRYTAREAHWHGIDTGGGAIAAILAETNHIASALGVEARHPFYDPRVVEYCLALPPEQKLHEGWTRMVLRRAMAGIVPEVIRWRTDKADLSPNFYRNLLQMEQAPITRLVTDDLDRLAPYINVDTLRAAHERENGDVLWQALILSRWLCRAEAVKKDDSIDRSLLNPYFTTPSFTFSGYPPS